MDAANFVHFLAWAIGWAFLVLGGLRLLLAFAAAVECRIIDALRMNREFIAFAYKRACDRHARRRQ